MKRALLLALVLGCPDSPSDDPVIVELVPAGKRAAEDPLGRITRSDFRRAVARMRLDREDTVYAGPLPDALKGPLLEQMIEQRLLAIEAARLGVKASMTAVAQEIDAMRHSLPEKRFQRFLVETYQTEADLSKSIAARLVRTQLLQREVVPTVKVTDEELQKAWEAVPEEERMRSARVHAAQIVVASEDVAEKIVRQLRKNPPADFAEIAKAQSVAPEGPKGGDLGWFEKGAMPAVFDEVCFALEIGQVSEVTPSELGYHIFKVLEREDARPRTFEEAKPALLEKLRDERLREAQDRYVATVMSRYRVVRHDDAPTE